MATTTTRFIIVIGLTGIETRYPVCFNSPGCDAEVSDSITDTVRTVGALYRPSSDAICTACGKSC